ncbi:MAG: pyrophosphatase [Alphaproteobacteria bacterium]|nr:pyrophosphatase [Alphaproteobacteria bacterium]
MTIDEYAAGAAGVAAVRMKPAERTDERELLHLALGLAGEAGEIADHLKKSLRGETWDRDRLAGELGDAIYQWARLCTLAGCSPSEVLDRSTRAIEARIARQAQM